MKRTHKRIKYRRRRQTIRNNKRLLYAKTKKTQKGGASQIVPAEHLPITYKNRGIRAARIFKTGLSKIYRSIVPRVAAEDGYTYVVQNDDIPSDKSDAKLNFTNYKGNTNAFYDYVTFEGTTGNHHDLERGDITLKKPFRIQNSHSLKILKRLLDNDHNVYVTGYKDIKFRKNVPDTITSNVKIQIKINTMPYDILGKINNQSITEYTIDNQHETFPVFKYTDKGTIEFKFQNISDEYEALEYDDDKTKFHKIKIKYDDKSEYVGQFKYKEDENRLIPDGTGQMTYSNGDVYEGEWKEGKRNGTGKMTYRNGDVYEGEWKNGEKMIENKIQTCVNKNSNYTIGDDITLLSYGVCYICQESITAIDLFTDNVYGHKSKLTDDNNKYIHLIHKECFEALKQREGICDNDKCKCPLDRGKYTFDLITPNYSYDGIQSLITLDKTEDQFNEDIQKIENILCV